MFFPSDFNRFNASNSLNVSDIAVQARKAVIDKILDHPGDPVTYRLTPVIVLFWV